MAHYFPSLFEVGMQEESEIDIIIFSFLAKTGSQQIKFVSP